VSEPLPDEGVCQTFAHPHDKWVDVEIRGCWMAEQLVHEACKQTQRSSVVMAAGMCSSFFGCGGLPADRMSWRCLVDAERRFLAKRRGALKLAGSLRGGMLPWECEAALAESEPCSAWSGACAVTEVQS
jgi:hypothetical protein